MKQELLDKVLEQIIKDVMSGDMTAVEILLADVSDETGQDYLPEGIAETSNESI